MVNIPYRVAIDYLAPTMDPVVSVKGRNAPTINPTLTYGDALAAGKQFDIIWVPAGSTLDVEPVNSLLKIKRRPRSGFCDGGEPYSGRRDCLHRAAGAEGKIFDGCLYWRISARARRGPRGKTRHDEQAVLSRSCRMSFQPSQFLSSFFVYRPQHQRILSGFLRPDGPWMGRCGAAPVLLQVPPFQLSGIG